MRRVVALAVVLTCSVVSLVAQGKKPASKTAEPVKPEPARPSPAPPMLKAFAGRSIGPAVMGGRISDIAFDKGNVASNVGE